MDFIRYSILALMNMTGEGGLGTRNHSIEGQNKLAHVNMSTAAQRS